MTRALESSNEATRRRFYLDMAKANAGFPIGTDLVLKEHADHEAILHDGTRLGKVVAAAAERFRTPLAIPVMDLLLEKAMLIGRLDGLEQTGADKWHFAACPTDAQIAQMRNALEGPLTPRLEANVGAVRYIAEHTPLVPVGMTIGPFSLMTKLVADPITPVYLAGTGLRGEDEPDVRMIEVLLDLSLAMVLRSMREQIRAGAKAIFMAEPAANRTYFSPNQMAAGSDVFDRIALAPLRRIQAMLAESGVDLIFHCCGELTEAMVQGFGSLRPVMLSLGSSRRLWEDANLVPRDVVLYGNLPSKRFYSDELIDLAEVRRQTHDLREKMARTGHPFILGTECDVLCVPGCEKTLMEKALVIVDNPPTTHGGIPSGHVAAKHSTASAA